MIKAGVAVDTWKAKKFKEELLKQEFKILKEFPFTAHIVIIQVELDETVEHTEKLRRLCVKMDIVLKRSN